METPAVEFPGKQIDKMEWEIFQTRKRAGLTFKVMIELRRLEC
jgi:hypothetical protein